MRKLLFIFLVFIGISASAQKSDKESYIKKESIGGNLDFEKKVEAQYSEMTSIPFGDMTFSKKDFALLLWAVSVRNLGIDSFDQTVKLWQEIYKRNLTDTEKKALKTGFNAKF